MLSCGCTISSSVKSLPALELLQVLIRHTYWVQYDAQFHLKLESNPSVNWSDIDIELLATWLSGNAIRENQLVSHVVIHNTWLLIAHGRLLAQTVLSCPVCSAAGHTARECPKLNQPVPPPAEERSTGDKFCHIYNRGMPKAL